MSMLSAMNEATDGPLDEEVVPVKKTPSVTAPPPKPWSTEASSSVSLQPMLPKPKPVAVIPTPTEAKPKVVKPAKPVESVVPMDTEVVPPPKPLKKKPAAATPAVSPPKRKSVPEEEETKERTTTTPPRKAQKLNGASSPAKAALWSPKDEDMTLVKKYLDTKGPFPDLLTPRQLFEKVVNAPSFAAIDKAIDASNLRLLVTTWLAVSGDMDTFDLQASRTALARLVQACPDAETLRQVRELLAGKGM